MPQQPRPEPHPLAFFSLVPHNDAAREAVGHPCNQHLVSLISGERAIDIGPHVRSKSPGTLATLGRGDADFFLEGKGISRIQCSFDMSTESNVVLFCDRSSGQTTQVFSLSGEEHFRFLGGQARKVVVCNEFNHLVGMGGARKNHLMFEIRWHYTSEEIGKRIEEYKSTVSFSDGDPRLARTADATPDSHQQLRWKSMYQLGKGQYGKVIKAIDVSSGRLIAVKVLNKRRRGFNQVDWDHYVDYILKREVAALLLLDHPHIVEYISCQPPQGPDGSTFEILMGLQDGNVESLVDQNLDPMFTREVARQVLHQVLQALDYLSGHGIIHRDVKPANILYVDRPVRGLHFKLGDFGLCNSVINATSRAGSDFYMAPEICTGGQQTDKVDVWSLMVTLLWILNAEDFRGSWYTSQADLYPAVMAAAQSSLGQLEEMTRMDPIQRASAAQMLLKYFGGEGLTTPRDEIVPLATSGAGAAGRAAAHTQLGPVTRSGTRTLAARLQGEDVAMM